MGGRLAERLVHAGHEVRCLVRDRDRASHLAALGCEVREGNVLQPSSLQGAGTGIDAAYYLVHSMGRGKAGDYRTKDVEAARAFATMARREGVERVIYLGGLGDRPQSEHLRSRHETAQALAAEGPALTYFRAAMVVGARSESYRTLRYLVERLPAMIAPAWIKTMTQPIAIDDVLAYLEQAPQVPASTGREVQIGGPDVLSYGEMLDRMADVLGRRAPAEGAGAVPVPAAFITVDRARDAGRCRRRTATRRGPLDHHRGHGPVGRGRVRRRAAELRRGAAPRPRRGHVLAEAPPQRVEQGLEREALEHVSLQAPARLLAERRCSRSAARRRAPRRPRAGPAAGLRSAPGPRSRSRRRPGHETTRSTSSRLSSSDAVWARRRARRACSSNSRVIAALPRLGSFSSRSSSASFTCASAAAPELVRPLQHRPPGRGQHPLRRRRAPPARPARRPRPRCGPRRPRRPAARRARRRRPRAARTRAPSRARRPRAVSCSATRAGGIAPKRIGRQRDGIVSSSRPGAELVSTKCAKPAGSSSVFRSAFWDSSFMRSASAITNTRTPRLERAAAPPGARSRSRTSSTRISCAPRGSTQAMSGCTPDSTRRRVSSGSSESRAISAAANSRAAARLPLPAGPWKR